MKVIIDGRAWIEKSDLTMSQLIKLRESLTIVPRRTSTEGDEDPKPIPLYEERDGLIGIPRQYFMERKRDAHLLDMRVTEGIKDKWAGPISFAGELRDEQQEASDHVIPKLRGGLLGTIVQAKPGWGKTVWSSALIAEMKVPTLVVVHKEFLMDQWVERLNEFLPGVKIGKVQQDVCDYEGKHVVMGMVHSLAIKDKYPEEFYKWPGMVIVDELHRIAARTWSPVPGMFPAKYRVGVTATPRRKDGAENVFFYHIGRVSFSAKEQRMVPRVRRVRTTFNFAKTTKFNPNTISRSILVNILVKSKSRNLAIVEQIVLAHRAGRKILVLSERLEHLSTLEKAVKKELENDPPSTGYYVGGMSPEEREESAQADIIFATNQYASEGMDIPALDTLFLTTPVGDVEQAVGRILRPKKGKKEPIVVDIRDDRVSRFRKNGEARDRYYKSIGVK